ncbi:MAG: aspartate-alanine antiporter [Enterobacteriaceae bacterium]|jgi:putative transport protein|nr:aspartate-alanine antiporter [Enterobacteriaceae bacterium]
MVIINWFIDVLKGHAELVIFLVLGIGYWVGKIKIGGGTLGAVTGTLLAGLIIGQLGIDISPQIKSIFFIMFLFAVGFGIGPQFIRGVTSDGIPQALFAVVISVLCLLSVYIVSIVSGYGPGIATGILAGSQTISASIGLATDAMSKIGLSPEQVQHELNNIPVAYAITYLFGTIGTGWIISFVGPKILRINLQEECKRYEKELNMGAPVGGIKSAWLKYIARAFKIQNSSQFLGKKISDIESSFHGELFVENIRRDGKLIEPKTNEVLTENDEILLSGDHNLMIDISEKEYEITDEELFDVPMESLDVYITSKSINGKTILELSQSPLARGVYVTRIKRGTHGVDIPVKAQTKIYHGDIISITGNQKHIEAVAAKIGYADRKADAASMIFIGAGIVIGGIIGSVVIPVNGIPITLSTSGGALIMGLIFGWLQSFMPKLGNVPSPTLWFMNSVGLNTFIAVVGVTAGPTFISGLKEAGLGIFGCGLISTAIPMLLAPLIGKYIFKFDPAINLGCCGGARTSTASVSMVADLAKSNVPMLGYTVPYAVSNTLLTIWGLVIVLMIR